MYIYKSTRPQMEWPTHFTVLLAPRWGNDVQTSWRSTTHSSECAIATSPTIAGGQRPTHPNVPLQPALQLLAVNDPINWMCHCNQRLQLIFKTTCQQKVICIVISLCILWTECNVCYVPLVPAVCLDLSFMFIYRDVSTTVTFNTPCYMM